MRVSGNFARVLFPLLASAAAPWAGAAETRVLSAVPVVQRVDVEAGVMLYQREWRLCAEDLDTGATRWSCPLPQNNYQNVMSTGFHHSIIYTDTGQVSVIEHETGKETQRLKVSGGRGKLNYAYLDRKDQWLVLNYDSAFVLCELATRREFRVPVPPNKISGARWMPDGKTFLFIERLSGDTPPTRAQVWFWEPGDSDPVAGCVLESPGRMYLAGILPGGQMLIREYDNSDPAKNAARIVDPVTGAVLREMPISNSPGIWSQSTNDCTRWYAPDMSANALDVQDMLGGEPLFSLQLHGLKWTRVASQHYEAGKDWILVWEENNNLWLVPLEKDGVPRLIVDGSRFLPGRVCRILPPHVLFYQNTAGSKAQSMALFTIDGMERKRSWTYGDSQSGSGQTMLSADTSRLSVSTYRWDNNAQTTRTYLMEDGQTEPLLEMEGENLTLSPDGRHVIYIKGEKRDQALLVNVDKREPVLSFTAEREYGIGAAVFSPTCRRAAVFHYPNMTVVDMVEGFPRHDMSFPASDQNSFINRFYESTGTLCFSPDETMLLAAGHGRAWLFNANTGECLHTFVEESRFVSQYQYRQGGFLRTLEGMAEDYMGKVTDRFKNRAPLSCAFIMDGLRAVTVAQNQLVRVWDVRTGQETGTIKTGLPETRNKQGSISNRCVLSANGAYLFSYNCDGFGKGTLWETASGRKLKEYPFPVGAYQAAVENDGRAVYLVILGDLHILPGRE